MRYKVTCLTPTLVGDGRKLSPIDYMVWKDQINVLDQTRIFKLLAKGPRLDGYLNQLKRADKLDFASWGGFAQNYAERRIPFESASLTAQWNRAAAESLFIPTFAAGPKGPYLPGAAIKGALRTGMLFAALKEPAIREAAEKSKADRPPRRPGLAAEDHLLGSGGADRMRLVAAGDSAPVPYQGFQIYLLRVSTLAARGQGYALGWKQTRGAADGGRPDDATPWFAEMAGPGVAFEGRWNERDFFRLPDVRRLLRWPENFDRARIFSAANDYAAAQLALHRQYAQWTGMAGLEARIAALETQLEQARNNGAALLQIGWGAGLLGKGAWLDTANADYRTVLERLSLYGNALKSGLPFPKTRRVVFLENKPASLPGWVMLEAG